MRLIFVRHGQSSNNAAYAASAGGAADTAAGKAAERDEHSGWAYPGRVPDPPLTALGLRQAEALGGALRLGRAPFRPTHLYSSLTTRAAQTARPLAEAVGLPVVLRPDLHEVGGIHHYDPVTRTRQPREGATLAALQAVCPPAVPGPGVDPVVPWAGGFEGDDALALPRARALLTDLRAAHGPDDVVTLVTHQYFSQFLIAVLIGLESPPWQRFRVDNTAHVAVRLEGGAVSVDWVNRGDHLAAADVTN
ncbi:histidine phosphatase family protein [Kineosporia sp. R_H_3]|uniref:histidine phosphatase family protein n=1 Tax=Kineosporia sp. R_H_3 TaxID=1961848 RepID=UPI00130428B1|nr:histidine phosphatase family protein [Kineosporia sp. R_H_3]